MSPIEQERFDCVRECAKRADAASHGGDRCRAADGCDLAGPNASVACGSEQSAVFCGALIVSTLKTRFFAQCGRGQRTGHESMDAHSASPIQLAKFVKFREERFGGVLFETRSEKVFTLNPTAAAVVRQIQAGSDRDAINQRLRTEFADQGDSIDTDVSGFLDELRKRALIVG